MASWIVSNLFEVPSRVKTRHSGFILTSQSWPESKWKILRRKLLVKLVSDFIFFLITIIFQIFTARGCKGKGNGFWVSVPISIWEGAQNLCQGNLNLNCVIKGPTLAAVMCCWLFSALWDNFESLCLSGMPKGTGYDWNWKMILVIDFHIFHWVDLKKKLKNHTCWKIILVNFHIFHRVDKEKTENDTYSRFLHIWNKNWKMILVVGFCIFRRLLLPHQRLFSSSATLTPHQRFLLPHQRLLLPQQRLLFIFLLSLHKQWEKKKRGEY